MSEAPRYSCLVPLGRRRLTGEGHSDAVSLMDHPLKQKERVGLQRATKVAVGVPESKALTILEARLYYKSGTVYLIKLFVNLKYIYAHARY